MRYISLFCYVTGFGFIGHAWLSELPLKSKFWISGEGVTLLVVGFLVQWFFTKEKE